MNVFMLGWEFPPYISGGLGTACYGLTRALDQLGTRVTFVLPRPVQPNATQHVQIRAPDERTERMISDYAAARRAAGVAAPTVGEEIPPPPGAGFRHTRFRAVDADIQPYARPAAGIAPDGESVRATETIAARAGVPTSTGVAVESAASVNAALNLGDAPPPVRMQSIIEPGGHYGGDLFAEIGRYAHSACAIATSERFDLVHAHDWMTFPAGMAVSALTGKPLIVHVHSTEFDRSGEHVNQRIYDIERAGMHAAACVIAVSQFTRNLIVARYGVPAHKVEVVHNAIDDNGPTLPKLLPIERDERIVLFLGRITMQKGPEYFLYAAKRVLDVMENVRFVMAGTGDMIRRMIELAAELGIGQRVLFTGFLRGDDLKRIYQMADLYVMPSVSEPFGITPLEALSHDVPVIISKQSGVSEILTHALKVDFWDVDEMANKIVAVLRHPPLHNTLRDHGSIEVGRLSWADSAQRCVEIYELVKSRGG